MRYSSPAAPGKNVKVAVSIKGVPDTVTTSYMTPSIGSAVPYQPHLIDRILQSWLLMMLVVLLVIALVWYAVGSWQSSAATGSSADGWPAITPSRRQKRLPAGKRSRAS